MKRLKQKQKGFTLVELIVVIAVIGILAGVMLPRFFGFTDDAREAAAISEAKNIRAIAETHYAQTGDWPTYTVNASKTTVTAGSQTYTFDGTVVPTMDSETPPAPTGGFTYQSNKGNAPLVTCDANGNISVP
ncbi:type II secretion system protein [Desulfosporosinus sp.]|uniref:type II secretion system protein n=1 Tax=Desulfosporosinus sp. TaxID=157907 RepID=UPI0025C5903D|nr:type II secretion system protein [Desulfosporosinus sp.]